MKQTLTTRQAADIISRDDSNSFTYDGALALAEYLEALECDTNSELELDLVAIRCDFSQWDSLQQWAEDYYGTNREGHGWKWNLDIADDADDDEADKIIQTFIEERGILIEFSAGIIVSAF
jgi:hypothetical protein